MRPCIGVQGICHPLCKWSDLNDGTYTLADVEMFHQTISELVEDHIKATQDTK